MGRKLDDTPRVLGPYKHGLGWRLIIRAEGKRVPTQVRASEAEVAAEKVALERRLIQQSGRTIRDALDLYREYLQRKGNKPSSIKTTLTRLTHFFPDVDLALPRLSARDGAKLYEARQAGAADTHRNELAEAKTFLTWCVRQDFLRANPLSNVTGIGKRKRGKDQLTVDEARQLVAMALDRARLGDQGALAVALLVYTGLRATELVNLRKRDLDDAGRVVRVQPAMGAADHLKSASARRTVALPAALQDLLRRATKDMGRDALIFAGHWRDWPNEQTGRLCELAGVPRVTAHGLRGGAATLATLATQDENAVARGLGHASPTTTRAHYIEPATLSQLQQERTASVLDRPAPQQSVTDDMTGEGHSADPLPDFVPKSLPLDEVASCDN